MQTSSPATFLNRSFVRSARTHSGIVRTTVGALLVLGMVAALGTSPAAAQSSAPAADGKAYTDHWRAHFDKQTAYMLRQRPSSRASQIRSVIQIAAKLDGLSLSKTTDALIEVIETDPTTKHRRLAVRALRQIGPEHLSVRQYERAMDRLYTLMQEEPSRKVRNAGVKALAPYLRSGPASTR